MLKAKLGSIKLPAKIINRQSTYASDVREFRQRLHESVSPPILVVKYPKKGIFVLDGFHRLKAHVKEQIPEIEAWILRPKDIKKLLDTEYGGKMPEFYFDLDHHIICGGKRYETLRDHV